MALGWNTRRAGDVTIPRSMGLTECFGGFTPANAPAMNRVQAAGGGWMVLIETGQVVLRSACSDRDAFLSHRDRLLDLVVSMGEDLDQADVFILAYASDSLLIEVAERRH